jgi:hypothetical protein
LENSEIHSQANITRLLLPGDQPLPGITAFSDHLKRVFPVLALAAESELVLRLSIWNLVNAEPLVRRSEQARQVPLDIFDVIELRSQRVIDINNDDLPVGFFLIQQSHDPEDFDLLDLAGVADKFANLTDVKWVIVALGFGFRMDYIGIFPCL